MTAPLESLYPEKSALPDWSVVNFSFEPDTALEDEDMLGVEEQEPDKTLREILNENDEEFINKQCSKCKKSLPLTSFSKNCFAKSGYKSQCKKCVQESSDQKKSTERTRKSRQKNPERFKELNRKWSTNFRAKHPEKPAEYKKKWKEKKNVNKLTKEIPIKIPREKKIKESSKKKAKTSNPWASKAVRGCRRRAKEKGLPFGMTSDDLSDKHTGSLPEFCPIFPHICLDYHAGPDRRLWASVDKIVPLLGYVSGNVWVISMAANRWKDNGSNAAERERIVSLMQGQKKKKEINPDQPSLFDGL